MKIVQNISTLNKVNQNNKSTASTLEKLSSGLRINRAADDSAGLAISEKMRAQIRGLAQAERNIQDGTSLIQTAEGALGIIQESNLQRLRELNIQAANDILTDKDRNKIQMEVKQIKQEINDIANNTHFNGINLLNIGSDEIKFISYIGKNITSLTKSTLIGNSHNIHTNGGIEILSGVNDELTIKFDGASYSITIAPGLYSNSDTLYNDINSKLTAAGAPVKLTDVHSNWDDSHMRTLLTSEMAGNHKIEVEGTAFNDVFAERNFVFGNYEVWGREADFSVGYTVIKDVNDTLNFKDNGVPKTIVLTEGSYSRDELIVELNKQLTNAGANISASVTGSGSGVNESSGPGNKHYMLKLKHHFSNEKNAIQLISGNALNPLFMRMTNPGDVWTPLTKSYLITDINISNGLTIESGQAAWEFTVDGSIKKSITLTSASYTSISLIDTLNNELSKISAGIIAVNDSGILKFEREMNGSSYTVSDFKIISNKMNNDVLKIQVGANSGNTFKINLTDVRITALGIEGIDLSTRQGAESAISKIDKAIEIVSSERAKFGAYQNALEHIHNNVSNYQVNLTAMESRIRDVDMAKKIMEFTKNNILSQTSQAMLAQANQQSQNVLQLLH